ncbi:hypothetical protein EB118_10850 [bacterium]|nr:hypothetical protein [bacterium]NDD83183.1 hypothetical protein [bacterium]NDG30553.1 hypothetical protein [bacterium]
MGTIPFDIFYKIAECLDYLSLTRFIVSSRRNYTFYKQNMNYLNNLLIQKVKRHFYLDLHTGDILVYSKLYKYFKNHRGTEYADILVYIIEAGMTCESSSAIFNELLNKCQIKHRTYNGVQGRHLVSYQDIKYMIAYSKKSHFLGLINHFIVPCSVIAYSIKQLLFTEKKSQIVDYKISLLIDHMYTKHCIRSFSEVDLIFVHTIIIELIKRRKVELIRHFFKKKSLYRVTMAYQIVVNELISNEVIEVFGLVKDHMDFDSLITDVVVIIDKSLLRTLAQRGSLWTLRCVITNFLGNAINNSTYINAIKSGLIESKKSYDLSCIQPFIDCDLTLTI